MPTGSPALSLDADHRIDRAQPVDVPHVSTRRENRYPCNLKAACSAMVAVLHRFNALNGGIQLEGAGEINDDTQLVRKRLDCDAGMACCLPELVTYPTTATASTSEGASVCHTRARQLVDQYQAGLEKMAPLKHQSRSRR